MLIWRKNGSSASRHHPLYDTIKITKVSGRVGTKRNIFFMDVPGGAQCQIISSSSMNFNFEVSIMIGLIFFLYLFVVMIITGLLRLSLLTQHHKFQ